MTIDLDEAKDRAERGLLLTARHGEVLVAELKRLRDCLTKANSAFEEAERRLYLKIGALEAKVEAYEEREPFVERVLCQCESARDDWGKPVFAEDVEAVRDFKVAR